MEMPKDLKRSLLIGVAVMTVLAAGGFSASLSASGVHASHVRRHIVRVAHHKRGRRLTLRSFRSHHHASHAKAVRYAPLTKRDLRFAESYTHTKSAYSETVSRKQGVMRLAHGSHKLIHGDCVSFIWGILAHSKRQVPREPWTTSRMLRKDGGTLKQVSAKHARRGDVILNGVHAGILLQNYHGKDTKMIEFGGINNHINVATVGNGFGSFASHFKFGEPAK